LPQREADRVPWPVRVGIRRLLHADGLPLPDYATPGSAGLDLRLAIPAGAQITLKKSERALAPTGLSLQLPKGVEAQVRPRSGLALRHGVTVLNAPGTIDSDYRGEVMVLLVNLGDEDVVLVRGDRIAQLVVAPVLDVRWTELEAVEATGRGTGGFGSTGSS
jgi:dUTP pyrophosphatase